MTLQPRAARLGLGPILVWAAMMSSATAAPPTYPPPLDGQFPTDGSASYPPSDGQCTTGACATAPTEEDELSSLLQTRSRFRQGAQRTDQVMRGDDEWVPPAEVVEETYEDYDCADEVVLRLAIADSMVVETYEKCMETYTNKWFKKGGQVENFMAEGKTNESIEKIAGSYCVNSLGNKIALGPRLIRMTFHDAADINNLMFVNGTIAPKVMGGVDSCLHTALASAGNQPDDTEDEEEVAKGNPNHNRGLTNAEKWVLRMAKATKLSRPDVQVLGAVVAMEAWLDGPEFGVEYGRKQGSCSKIICANENCWHHDTPFFVQPVAEPVSGGMFCPMTNTMGPLIELLNMTTEEMVALQGAHSVGGVIVCSGLGGVQAGPYCPSKCGVPPGDYVKEKNLNGVAFDDTPGKLDNRYYQLLMNEEYEDLPACSVVAPEFPFLATNGLGKAGAQSDYGNGVVDKSETCTAGVGYESESQCDVEACAEACTLTQECQDAENYDEDDHEAFLFALEGCNGCKALCSSKHVKALAGPAGQEFKQNCISDCAAGDACVKSANEWVTWGVEVKNCNAKKTQCYEDGNVVGFKVGPCKAACNQKKLQDCYPPCNSLPNGAEKNKCKQECNGVAQACHAVCNDQQKKFQSCHKDVWLPCQAEWQDLNKLKLECNQCKIGCNAKAAAYAESIYNSSMEKRPVRWCKNLPDEKHCLDPDIDMGINGGWGACPPEKRITTPNIGQGRLTTIKNLERWTTFRGLHKRVMVLPSDWSWLGKPETKALFQQYGTDEDAWKLNFKKAWAKLVKTGWGDSLKTCAKVTCTTSDGTISCPVSPVGIGSMGGSGTTEFNKKRQEAGLPDFERPTSLEFPVSGCSPALGEEDAEDCEIIGGVGVKGKLLCGSWTGVCATTAALEAEARIAEQWEAGGKTPPCGDSVDLHMK